MDDRTAIPNNQFVLSPEQLRQLQNIAGLLGNNFLSNPLAWAQLANSNNSNNNSATPNSNSTSTPSSNTNNNNTSNNVNNIASQLLNNNSQLAQLANQTQQLQQPQHNAGSHHHQVSRRGRRPKHSGLPGHSLMPSGGGGGGGGGGASGAGSGAGAGGGESSSAIAAAAAVAAAAANAGAGVTSGVGSGLAGLNSSGTMDNQVNQRLQLQQTLRLIRQQQHQQQRRQQQQQQEQQQQQLIQQEFTQRLQQQLQQIVQQSQRPQSQQPPIPSQTGDQATLSIRQPTLQNALPGGGMAEQKRKRGRPPLSGPSTSAPTTSGMDLSYLNSMFSNAMKNQERERNLQQDRLREIRQQQERERQRELRAAQERAERQRELIMQQERERQRLELERQRKAQHRQALQDYERERRRQHMIMIRNLDAYKRNEDREKTTEAMVAEKNKQLELRMYQKRLEAELLKEIREPVDDMMLNNHKPLATLNRIPGLKLPGKAFADLLMSYEFLFNFGETVGLELKTIPDINTLQLGLMNLSTWAEDQLIFTLHHLCMFGIKDPRFPYSGSLKEIESLEQTNEGLSQLLHFYLQVMTLNAKTKMEHENRLFELIQQKYFLSLNATQKAEMFAFICNELLCSQTVAKQMEDTIENIAKFRKDKWVLENELRKYRTIQNRREYKREAAEKAKEAAEAAAAVAAAAAEAAEANGQSEKKEDDKTTDSTEDIKQEVKKDEEKSSKASATNGALAVAMETDASLNIAANLEDDLEPSMSDEDLVKKIENLTRQYNKTSNKLEKAINSMRAAPLGQDRYRRRYWVLPQVGGIFVEGMESSEPHELENNKFTEEELVEYEKEEEALAKDQAKEAEGADGDGADVETAEDGDENAGEDGVDGVGDEDAKTVTKEDKDDEENEKDDPTKEEDEEMVDENGVDPAEMKDDVKTELENGETEVAEKSLNSGPKRTTSLPTSNAPWFSILPREPCDVTKPLTVKKEQTPPNSEECPKDSIEEENTDAEVKTEMTLDELKAKRHEICPNLAKRYDEMIAQLHEKAKKIHPQYQFGWWRITDTQQLKSILNALNERGSREKPLHKQLSRYFQYACNSCRNSTVDFEITSYDRQLAGKNYGAPLPHTDEDSADDLRGEEEEEEEDEADELDEETGDDKSAPPAAAPAKKSKRRKATRSARSRRLRARAAARKKVENSRSKIAQR